LSKFISDLSSECKSYVGCTETEGKRQMARPHIPLSVTVPI